VFVAEAKTPAEQPDDSSYGGVLKMLANKGFTYTQPKPSDFRPGEAFKFVEVFKNEKPCGQINFDSTNPRYPVMTISSQDNRPPSGERRFSFFGPTNPSQRTRLEKAINNALGPWSPPPRNPKQK
jgi:hypothetical protein